MTPTRRPLAASLTLVAALICAGCTQSSASPAETPTTALPPPPTTSSAPALTPEQQNEKDAEQAVVNLIDVANTVGTNPDEPLEQLATVARGDSLTFWRESRFRQRAMERSQIGNMSVEPISATSTTDSSYEVPACLDVSNVDVLDKNGESTVTPERLPRAAYVYVVDKTSDGFFVTSETATGSC